MTALFQLIIDTYGVPTYKEANPNPIQIITFPFQFGMMFGDMGHGSVILLFGLFLTLGEPWLKNGKGFLKSMVPMRYLLLFMGMSATFCGFCYNEFFSLPLNLFDSCYKSDNSGVVGTGKMQYMFVNNTKLEYPAPGTGSYYLPETTPTGTGKWYFPREDAGCTYPIGIDPVWGLTENRLTFVNNIKMKLAVIIGVLHMTMGVIIKGTNDVYFKRWPGFIFDVCAGIIILEGLFGWMDLLIFAKWFFQPNFGDNTIIRSGLNATGSVDGTSPAITTFQKTFKGDYINNRAPGVITVLINGVFGGGAPPPGTGTEFAYVGAGGYFETVNSVETD